MNTRQRHFELVLYDDNEVHKDFIKNDLPYFTNVYILHDRDITDSGELKKPHYHIIISFDNARTLSAVQKELDMIEPNLINAVKSLQAYVRYLIHLDTPNKEPYEIDEIKGNNTETMMKYLGNKINETDKVIEILEIIDDNRMRPLKLIVAEIASRGLWSEFRRGGVIFMKIIEQGGK